MSRCAAQLAHIIPKTEKRCKPQKTEDEMDERKMMGSGLQIGNSFTMYTVMKNREFRKLCEASDTHAMQDCDARKFVAKMFGFEEKKVEIVRLVPMYEYDGNSMWKLSDIAVERPALYNASDWNYIRFKVCDVCWEVVNGHIYTVSE